jgi:branched-subunit amino acid transport protein
VSDALFVWIVIAGMTGVTIATRSVFLLLPARLKLPAGVQRALRYAPACALVAIIVPEMVTNQHVMSLGPENARLWAGIAAMGFYAVRRNMIAMILLGMLILTALRLWPL